MHASPSPWLALALATLGGCGGDAPGAAIVASRAECENLNPEHCMLPWPSSRFLVDDPTTVTGRRLELSTDILPKNQFDEPVASLDPWNRFDGFSPLTPIMTVFAGELDTTNLPDETRIADSLAADSPTILLDAVSGERVAHFAELDLWPDATPERQSFYMRPATRLAENHRYIVAIRDLEKTDGTPVTPWPYFQALRDGTPTDVAELEARRAAYDDIFTRLETANIPRGSLLEAWEFRTASASSLSSDLVGMRDQAYAQIGPRGIGCTVTEVVDNVNTETWRLIRGTFTVPLYMTTAAEGALANRGPDGAVVQNGTAEANFVVVIPHSVHDSIMAGGAAARLMMYGHGLLGTAEQVNSGGTRHTLQQLGMVGVGTDYWGLSEPDERQFVNQVITNFGNFNQVGERLMQGSINSLVLARSFKGICSELPELQVGGVLTYDPATLYYYGISQGGMVGGTLAALGTDIDAYVLQAGAIGYTMLMRRSSTFEVFERIYKLWYRDSLDRHVIIASIQAAWDLGESSTYAPHVLQDPLPLSATQRVLYQTVQYDVLVGNPASDVAARTYKLPVLRSSVYHPWNTPVVDAPVDSAYVIYDLDNVGPIPLGSSKPPIDNNAHGDLRYMQPVIDQIDAYFQPGGQVIDTCPAADCNIVNTGRP